MQNNNEKNKFKSNFVADESRNEAEIDDANHKVSPATDTRKQLSSPATDTTKQL